jgi:hypothetical protein
MNVVADRRQNQSDTKSGALVAQSDMARIEELDAFCKSSALAIQSAHDAGSDMQKALVMARTTSGIKRRLTSEIMADVMELQGSMLGFRTDKDRDGGYPVEVVRDVLTQALIRRLRVCGNEFNIIAGNLYVTKEGSKRLVSEFDGLTDLEISMGVPVKASETTALVPCTARWKYRGDPKVLECLKTEEMDARIAVKLDARTGQDAVLGKAKAKLYGRIYERLTGSPISSVDDELVDPETTEVLVSSTLLSSDATYETVAEVVDTVVETVPEHEPLPADFLAALEAAVKAAKTPQQLENAKAFWLQKAVNRNLTVGQQASVSAMFG